MVDLTCISYIILDVISLNILKQVKFVGNLWELMRNSEEIHFELKNLKKLSKFIDI